MYLYAFDDTRKSNSIKVMFRTLSEKWLRRTSVRYINLQVRNLIRHTIYSINNVVCCAVWCDRLVAHIFVVSKHEKCE